jgi:hypothetical protein
VTSRQSLGQLLEDSPMPRRIDAFGRTDSRRASSKQIVLVLRRYAGVRINRDSFGVTPSLDAGVARRRAAMFTRVTKVASLMAFSSPSNHCLVRPGEAQPARCMREDDCAHAARGLRLGPAAQARR